MHKICPAVLVISLVLVVAMAIWLSKLKDKTDDKSKKQMKAAKVVLGVSIGAAVLSGLCLMWGHKGGYSSPRDLSYYLS